MERIQVEVPRLWHNRHHFNVRIMRSTAIVALVLVTFQSLITPTSATSGGIAASLPEVLPAVQRLPGEDVTRESDRIVHATLTEDDDEVFASDDNFSQEGQEGIKNSEDEEWRKSLPVQLQERRGTLNRLLVPFGNRNKNDADDNGICEIYLLGTSHVSKDSCEDARLLMEHVRPDVLFVELCHQRLAILADDSAPADDVVAGEQESSSSGENQGKGNKKKKKRKEKQSRGMSFSANMLTKIQQDYATKLGVAIGAEFRESYKAACKQQRSLEEEMNRRRFGLVNNPSSATEDIGPAITLVLGDRPVRLTILRAWESLRLFGKIKLVVGLLWSSLRSPSEKELKEWMEKIVNDATNDLLTDSIAELSKHFPQIGQTIIHERDQYMVCKLRQTVNLLGINNVPSAGRRRRIVAVVGAGHCPGMMDMLKDAHSKDTDGGTSLEERLRNLVETKKWKVENQDIKSLTTDVTELHLQQ